MTELGFTTAQIDHIVKLTGGDSDTVGYTFSDLTQRLLPTLILDAYPDRPVRFERAVEIIQAMKATPRFREGKA